MTEQEFIYGKLHYLTEQVNFLTGVMEQQSELLGRVLNIIEQMQSPEYASKQVKMAEMKDVADKIKFIREYASKLKK